MRVLVALVSSLLLLHGLSTTAAASPYDCDGTYPEGRGSLPFEFVMDGVPRAHVRVSLPNTSVPDQITGSDGRAVFRDLPYGCYNILAEWHTGEWLTSYAIAHYLLLPDKLLTPWDAPVDGVRLVVTTGTRGNSSYNPESGSRLRVPCEGPWPEGRGTIPVRFFMTLPGPIIEPRNLVRVSLLNTTYPDQITWYDGQGEPGWAFFKGVPYGCYRVRFEWASTGQLTSHTSEVIVLPEGVYLWGYRVDYVRVYAGEVN